MRHLLVLTFCVSGCGVELPIGFGLTDGGSDSGLGGDDAGPPDAADAMIPADDAGADGGAVDAKADAVLHDDGGDGDADDPCTPTSCDDGLRCNGEETCDPDNGCVSGTAVDCSDGIACTDDLCTEPSGACTHRAPDQDGDDHADEDCLDLNGIPLGDDCDDRNIARFGGQPEFCDNVDNDCDGTADNDTVEIPWYVDVDGDGFGSATDTSPTTSCSPVIGASPLNTDCDDSNVNRHPGAWCPDS